MRNLALKLSLAAVLVAACVFVVGCKRSAPPAQEPPAPPKDAAPAAAPVKLEGSIRISGAWALYPMMERWKEEFAKINPAVKIEVSGGGAGKGMTDALSGLVEIAMVSREVTPGEVEKGAVYVPVVSDAVFATINAQNPLLKGELATRGVRKQALVDLWLNGKTMAWGEMCGAASADRVILFTRADSCGAAEVWAQYLGNKKQDALKGTGVNADPGVAEAVKNDKFALGFNNLNFAFDSTTGKLQEGLAILPVDLNENGKIDPEEQFTDMAKAIDAIRKGVYPSPPARPLNLVAKTQFQGISVEFVRWILTDGQKFALEAGYLPLTPEKAAEALKKLPAK